MTPPRRSGAGRGPRPAAAGEGSDPKTWPVRTAASYGGVVVRDGTDGPEVALIRPQSTESKQVWALPKGGKENGERPEDAALREVLEETGMGAEVVDKLDTITYWFAWAPEKVRYKKAVHFFLMRHSDGRPEPDGVEVAEVRFFPIDEAPTRATYPSERKVLKQAADLVRSQARRRVQP